MKLSAILVPLIAAKVPHDIIMQTVLAWEAEQSDALEKRRAADRDRQAKKRACHVTSRDVTVTGSSHMRVEVSSSKKYITGKKELDSAAAPRGDLADFKSELSSILDPERIEAIAAVRRKKGATMTANTGRLLVAAIRCCPLSPGEVADEMALRNWTSVKPEWLETKSQSQKQKSKPQTVGDLFREEARRFSDEQQPIQPATGYLDTSNAAGNRQRFGELIQFAIPGGR